MAKLTQAAIRPTYYSYSKVIFLYLSTMNDEEQRIFRALPAIDEYTLEGKTLRFLKDGNFVYYTKSEPEDTIRGTYYVVRRHDDLYHVVTNPNIGELIVSIALHPQLSNR